MTSFEQTQSIVTRIQQILRDYPYGNAVLLELLQNADDAKAKSAQAVFEAFSANEHNPAAKSPALLFYNSATFTERDLQNIQNIGGLEETSKRHDATKVGRFGIGFNSSFHVSDVVAFITGHDLIVFDPARENLPPMQHGARTGGMKWNIPTFETDERFTEAQKQFARDVLQAFEHGGLGFKRGTYYNGTIFRLPLRTKPSTLWREVHRPSDIAKLMIEFFESATLGMVVLKNIEGISAKIHRRGPMQPLETLFDVTAACEKDAELKGGIVKWLKEYTEVIAHVMAATDQVQVTEHYHRDRVNIQRESIARLPAPKLMLGETVVTLYRGPFLSPFSAVVNRNWDTNAEFFSALNVLSSESTTTIIDGQQQQQEKPSDDIIQFQIAHQFGPGSGWRDSKVWEIASHSAQCRHPVDVPWSATIVNVCGTVDDGRLMCFFPIRQGTRLPVHIHGYFHVSSDRQSIKGLNDAWNAALISEVIPFSYVAAIKEVRKHHSRNFYKLWPTLNYTDETINLISKRTLALLEHEPCVAAADGTWQRIGDLVVPFLIDGAYYQPSAASTAAIHCLLVAASQYQQATQQQSNFRGSISLSPQQQQQNHSRRAIATFPAFDVTKPPSADQMEELRSLVNAFKVAVAPLTPELLRLILQNIPPIAAKLYLNAATIAMELFLMCTIGANHKVPEYYARLPIIPLAYNPNASVAFVDGKPLQLIKDAATQHLVVSSYATTPCLVCKTKASVAFAKEAFPEKVIKTLLTKAEEDGAENEDLIRRVEGYFTAAAFQKQLHIATVSPRHIAELLSRAIANGSIFTWKRTMRNNDNNNNSINDNTNNNNISSATWTLVCDAVGGPNGHSAISLSATALNDFLNETLLLHGAEEDAKTLLSVPFVPICPRLASPPSSVASPTLTSPTGAQQGASVLTAAAELAESTPSRQSIAIATIFELQPSNNSRLPSGGVGGGGSGGPPPICIDTPCFLSATTLADDQKLATLLHNEQFGIAIDTTIIDFNVVKKLPREVPVLQLSGHGTVSLLRGAMSPKTRHELEKMELAKQRKLLSYQPLPLKTSVSPALADALLTHFARTHQTLLAEDVSFLKTLPMFVTVDNRLVPIICSNNNAASSPTAPNAAAAGKPSSTTAPSSPTSARGNAVLLPSDISDIITSAGHLCGQLMALFTDEKTSQGISVDIIAEGSTQTVTFLERVLGVSRLSKAEFLACAATTSDTLAAGAEGSLGRWLWLSLTTELSKINFLTPLLSRLLSKLVDRPVFRDAWGNAVTPRSAIIQNSRLKTETYRLLESFHQLGVNQQQQQQQSGSNTGNAGNVGGTCVNNNAALFASVPRVVSFGAQGLSEEQTVRVADMMGIASFVQPRFLVPIAKALGVRMSTAAAAASPSSSPSPIAAPAIVHKDVTHVLELIGAAKDVGPDVIGELMNIPFVPVLDYERLLQLRKPTSTSAGSSGNALSPSSPPQSATSAPAAGSPSSLGGTADLMGTLVAPRFVLVETAYRPFPHPNRAKYCLHPHVASTHIRAAYDLLKWSEGPSFEVLIGFSKAACDDCNRRRAEAARKANATLKQQDSTTTMSQQQRTKSPFGRSKSPNAHANNDAPNGAAAAMTTTSDDADKKKAAASASSPPAIEAPPAQFNEMYIKEAYTEIDRLLSNSASHGDTSRHAGYVAAVTNANFAMYFPSVDAVGTAESICYSSKAVKLAPLFIHVNYNLKNEWRTLFTAMKICEQHDQARIIAATNRIPAMRDPNCTNTADLTKVILTDSDRELFRDTLDYLYSVIMGQRAADADPEVVSSQLLVPTSDNRCNYAINTYYDYYNLEVQEPSNTVLWNGILPTVARFLGMKHTGLNVLSQFNTMGKKAGGGGVGGLQAAGQRLSLLNGIKRILTDYSDPTALLFEMIQNADDANARRVEFILDLRTFKSDGAPEGFFGNGMRSQQGPALIVKNDAVFKPEDFEAIHDIGVGHKSTDAKKIGRFGVGFNSVYHITDCPSVVSAGKLLIFDPSLAHIDIATANEPGVVLEHAAVPNLAKHFPQQLQPYEAHGVKFGQHYDGTLFRLPLRSRPSPISQAKPTPDTLLQWFNEFQKVAGDVTLFLKSIEHIQISIISASGIPSLRFLSSIQNTEQVRRYRKELSNRCVHNVITQCRARPAPTPTGGATDLNDGARSITDDAIQCDYEIVVEPGGPRKFRVFSLVDQPSREIQNIVPAELARKLSASVTIAMLLRQSVPSEAARPDAPTAIAGRLHAFLPLPSKPLPFHAHGIFAVSSDRKGVWTSNVTGAASWDILWNKYLMDTVLPRCFVGCMASLRPSVAREGANALWRCWPTAEGELIPLATEIIRLTAHHNAAILPATYPESLVTFRDCVHMSASASLGAAREAILGLMEVTRHAIVITPPAYESSFKARGENELNTATIVRILKGVAGSQNFVPYSAVFPEQRSPHMYNILTAQLERFCVAGKVSLEGLPLTPVKTVELAVIREDNPCFYVSEDKAHLFKELCPHLSERNTLLTHTFDEKLYRFPFFAASLVHVFPTISKMRGLHFLSPTSMTVTSPSPNANNCVLWDADPLSTSARWLAAFWELMDRSDLRDKELEKYPIIPVRGLVSDKRTGQKLRSIREKQFITNGSQGLRVLSDLVTKLHVENVDPSFIMSNKIVSLCEIKVVSLFHIVERAASHADVFDDFNDQDRDAIRRALLTSPSALPPAVRQLPIFKVYLNGRAQHTPLNAVTRAIPTGAPLTALCEGMALEPCNHSSASIPPLSAEEFIAHVFIPNLGKLALTDELENWRFVRRNASVALNKEVAGVAASITFPTSIANTKAMASPAGMPLAAQVLKFMCLNDMTSAFDHPTFAKYAPYARHVALSTVSVTRRANEYIHPLRDRYRNKPLNGIINTLHQIFASQNLMSVFPLPPIIAADDDVASAFRALKPPAAIKDVVHSLVHCYLALMMSADGRSWIAKQVTAGRAGTKERDVLTVVTTSVALELNAYLSDSALDIKLTLGTLPVCNVPSYPDSLTRQLHSCMPLEARRCPSALNTVTGQRPFHSPIPLRIQPISMCAKYSKRWLCWTQCPLLHPLFDTAIDDKHALQPTVAIVLAHIEEMVKSQKHISPAVLKESLAHCYEFLAGRPIGEFHEIPKITSREFCALPPDANKDGLVRCVSVDAIVDLVVVKFPEGRRVPLAPYYYTLADDFPGCPQLANVVRRISTPALPRPPAVLSAIKASGLQVTSLYGTMRGFAERQYECLLRILIASCGHYATGMEWQQNIAAIEIQPSSIKGGGSTDNKSAPLKQQQQQQQQKQQQGDLGGGVDAKNHMAVNMSSIPVPQWHSQGLIPAKDACAPDDPILLGRLSHAARITDLPLDLCVMMRIQPVSLRITETPSKIRPFTEESIKNNTVTIPRNCKLSRVEETVAAITALNAFFPSLTFSRIFDRILATNKAKRAAIVVDPSVAYGVRIIAVSELITRIIDNRFPNDPIYSEAPATLAQSVIIASNVTTKEIFINPIAAATLKVPLEALVAKEVGKMLGGTLIEIMPLTAVLGMVVTEAQHRSPNVTGPHRMCHWSPDIDFEASLDLLGCIAAEDKRHDVIPGLGGLKDDAALFRLSELTGVDFSCKDTAIRRQKREDTLLTTRVLDRFLLCRDDPINILNPIASASLPQTAEGAEICERDLALYYSTPLPSLTFTTTTTTTTTMSPTTQTPAAAPRAMAHHASSPHYGHSPTSPSSQSRTTTTTINSTRSVEVGGTMLFQTDAAVKGGVVVGGVEKRNGVVRHVAVRSAVVVDSVIAANSSAVGHQEMCYYTI